MANNQKISFDDIKLLKSFFSEGKFSTLSSHIKKLKENIIQLNENARKAEKEQLNQISEKEKKAQENVAPVSFTAKTETDKTEQAVKPQVEKTQTIANTTQTNTNNQIHNAQSQNNANNVSNNQYANNQNSYRRNNVNNNYNNASQNGRYQPNNQNNNYRTNNNGYNQNNNSNTQNNYHNQNRNQNGYNNANQSYTQNRQQNQFNRNGQNGNRPYTNNNYQGNNYQGNNYQGNNYRNNNYQGNNNQNSNYQGNNPNNSRFNNGRPPYNGANRQPFNNGTKPGFNRSNTPYLNRVNNSKPSFLNKPKFEKPAPIIAPTPQRDFGNKKKSGTSYEEKKVYSKRDLLKRGMISVDGFEDRMLSRKIRTKKKDQNDQMVIKPAGPTIITTENLTVKILSEATGKSVSEIIKNFMLLGMTVTINSTIDFPTAELIANEMGIEIQQKLNKTGEDKLVDVENDIKTYSDSDAETRPPIVTVMGHVDHGKTSLLDYIKKTKVTQGEAGGITQHIGAYKVEANGKSITFIDTPGHEAFTMMRARGASITDIAILVVAADDGIMPQTIEAINHIKAAKVPMIVAINKMDKPQADPDRVMQQLAEHNVLPEAWGGDAIIVKISALTGEGIDKLLETILLVSEVQELKANPNAHAIGTVLESRLDKGRGPIASLIVKDGSLKVGDTLVCGTSVCKVKALIDENNNNLKIATPSTPVSVLGFNEVPTAGDSFTVVEEKLSKEIISERISKQKIELSKTSSANTLEDLITKTSEGNVKVLNILIKTDVGGTLEAIKQSVMKLNNEEVKINILHSGVGAISESDVILANASNAMIIGFNVRIESKVKTVAERNKVIIKNYKIIYELLDDLELTMKGMKEPKYEEVYLGKAEIIQVFKLSTSGMVAGCRVKDGVVVRNEHARITRNGEIVVDTMINSVKIVKDDVKEAGKDRECGIKLNTDNYKVGDIVECYTLKRIDI